jgi:hypothetical protein
MPVTGLSGDRPAVLRYSSRIRTEPRKRILRLCAATQCRLHFAHLRTLVLEWGDWTGYFWLGRGVDLFFCLSGFFLTSPVLTPLQTSNTSAGTPQPFGCAGSILPTVFWSIFLALACHGCFAGAGANKLSDWYMSRQLGKPHCRWEELCLRAKVDARSLFWSRL